MPRRAGPVLHVVAVAASRSGTGRNFVRIQSVSGKNSLESLQDSTELVLCEKVGSVYTIAFDQSRRRRRRGTGKRRSESIWNLQARR